MGGTGRKVGPLRTPWSLPPPRLDGIRSLDLRRSCLSETALMGSRDFRLSYSGPSMGSPLTAALRHWSKRTRSASLGSPLKGLSVVEELGDEAPLARSAPACGHQEQKGCG